MKRNTIIILGLVVALTALAGCCNPGKVMTFFNKCPHERPYFVYGKVVDMECNPIKNCKIVIVKRFFAVPDTSCENKGGKVLGEHPVALTDITGDYSFCFEPMGANDVWLYFDARDNGYNPQYVEINQLMGPTILQTPGNSPIIVDIVLEKT